jgi:uric acid-xanthine permease
MISASLIGCGILSLVQMSRLKLWGRYYLGTGLLSVVGTSFATLSTAFAVRHLTNPSTCYINTNQSTHQIFDAMYKDGTCKSQTASDGTITRLPCPLAYGKLLGTALICSFLEMAMSFVPVRALKRIFPPIVTGMLSHSNSSHYLFILLSM